MSMCEDCYHWPSADRVRPVQQANPEVGSAAAIVAQARSTLAEAQEVRRQAAAEAQAQRGRMVERLRRARRRGRRYLAAMRVGAARERAAILAGVERDVAVCVRQAVSVLAGREPAASLEDVRALVARILAEAGQENVRVWTDPAMAQGLDAQADEALGPGEVRVQRADGAAWRSDAATRRERVRAALEEVGGDVECD